MRETGVISGNRPTEVCRRMLAEGPRALSFSRTDYVPAVYDLLNEKTCKPLTRVYRALQFFGMMKGRQAGVGLHRHVPAVERFL